MLAVPFVQEANHLVVGQGAPFFCQGGVRFRGAPVGGLGTALQAGGHETVLVLEARDLQGKEREREGEIQCEEARFKSR